MHRRRRRRRDRDRAGVPRHRHRRDRARERRSAPDAETDSFNEGESPGLDAGRAHRGRGRVLGGATALWAGQCLPPEPTTFERATVGPAQRLALRRQRARAVPSARRGALPDRGRGLRRARLGPLRRRASGDGSGRLRHRFSVWCPEPHLGRLYRDRAGRLGEREGAAERHRDRVVDHARRGRVRVRPRRDAGGQDGDRARARACVLCARRDRERPPAARLDRHQPAGSATARLVGRFFQDHPNLHAP